MSRTYTAEETSSCAFIETTLSAGGNDYDVAAEFYGQQFSRGVQSELCDFEAKDSVTGAPAEDPTVLKELRSQLRRLAYSDAVLDRYSFN